MGGQEERIDSKEKGSIDDGSWGSAVVPWMGHCRPLGPGPGTAGSAAQLDVGGLGPCVLIGGQGPPVSEGGLGPPVRETLQREAGHCAGCWMPACSAAACPRQEQGPESSRNDRPSFVPTAGGAWFGRVQRRPGAAEGPDVQEEDEVQLSGVARRKWGSIESPTDQALPRSSLCSSGSAVAHEIGSHGSCGRARGPTWRSRGAAVGSRMPLACRARRSALGAGSLRRWHLDHDGRQGEFSGGRGGPLASPTGGLHASPGRVLGTRPAPLGVLRRAGGVWRSAPAHWFWHPGRCC